MIPRAVGSCVVLVVMGLVAPAYGQRTNPPKEETKTIDRLLYEALRVAHDKGADLYNNGYATDCYRLFQGALTTAHGMLGHRPELQKTITDGMAKADRAETVRERAYQHHELIEKVRAELRGEVLTVPPREVKSPPKTDPKTAPKPDPKPTGKVAEIKTGIVGRVFWQGKPLEEVEVTFVTLDQAVPKVYETTSGAQGVYTLTHLQPGKYVITLVPGPKCAVKKLPERYATTTTSPLTVDAKGDGEKLDFMLQ